MKPFQLIFKYAHKYTLYLTITAISMLALVGVQLLIPWVIKLLVAEVTKTGATTQAMG